MLTLISIFTSLAFIVFGSLSGLKNLFNNLEGQITRIMILGCIWWLCLINLIFIFLFCIGKLIQSDYISSKKRDTSNIWQKYPIVWWSNYIILSVLLCVSWIYYLENRNGLAILDILLKSNSLVTIISGSLLIFVVIIVSFFLLNKFTCIIFEKKQSEDEK